jgi:hypothetical protein
MLNCKDHSYNTVDFLAYSIPGQKSKIRIVICVTKIKFFFWILKSWSLSESLIFTEYKNYYFTKIRSTKKIPHFPTSPLPHFPTTPPIHTNSPLKTFQKTKIYWKSSPYSTNRSASKRLLNVDRTTSLKSVVGQLTANRSILTKSLESR